jgi:hypothetical protein
MSILLPANITFKCVGRSLTGMQANIQPASDTLVTMQGEPVGKLFAVTFNDRYGALKDGDLIVNEADSSETYRIRGVKHLPGPKLIHSHCLAERGLA